MRSKQFNFYVHPEEEKELYDFLQSFPKMVRSATIKAVLINYMNSETNRQPIFCNFSTIQRNTQKEKENQNFGQELQFTDKIELSEDDLL